MKLSRYKHDSELSYAFGATLVYELAKTHPELITRVFLRPDLSMQGKKIIEILSMLRGLEIEIIENNKVFNVLGAKESCLLIAEFQKPNTTLTPIGTAHIVLVNPSDSGNLGAIMRSAVAFGYQDIAIITPAVDAYDPKTIRASMGAIFHLNIQQFSSFENYSQLYGNFGTNPRKYYAFMLNKNAQKLTELSRIGNNYAIIFGNEATGLPESFANIAQPIFIPQSDNVDSLNLSVASSIAMYHFSQQK
jgi:TrmH family RNA methyltransferase